MNSDAAVPATQRWQILVTTDNAVNRYQYTQRLV